MRAAWLVRDYSNCLAGCCDGPESYNDGFRLEAIVRLKTRLSVAVVYIFIGVAPSLSLPFQQTRSQFPGQPEMQEQDEQHRRLEREQAKKLNQQRHENLKRDTDKLVKLSNELKQYVDKSNENVLSVDVIKKAEEIEKLARSVREKMKGY
jgi:hypothetical protein